MYTHCFFPIQKPNLSLFPCDHGYDVEGSEFDGPQRSRKQERNFGKKWGEGRRGRSQENISVDIGLAVGGARGTLTSPQKEQTFVYENEGKGRARRASGNKGK